MPKPSLEEERTDRRPERTRQWLQNALIELVQEVDYADITIQMIVDRANIARITFYRHYRDKNELLLDYLDMIDKTITPLLQPVTPSTLANRNSELPNLRLMLYVAENRALYKALFCGSAAAITRRYTIAMMMRYATGNISLLLAHLDAQTQHMVAQCITNTTFGMIVWWLENDAPCDAQALAELVYKYNVTGVIGFMRS